MAKKKKSKVTKVGEAAILSELPLSESPRQDSQEYAAAKDSELSVLEKYLSPQELEMYSNLDKDLELSNESEMDEMISKLQEVRLGEPDIKIHSEATVDRTEMIQNELQYLCTILSPEECRDLCFEVYYSLLNDESVSHLDLSDIITDSLKPTLARTALVKADAEHKYSTAQYIQVYNCLRMAQLQYSLVFGQAMLDGLKAGADSIYWSGGKFQRNSTTGSDTSTSS